MWSPDLTASSWPRLARGTPLYILESGNRYETNLEAYPRNVFNPIHEGIQVYGRGDAWLKWPDRNEAEEADFPVTAITSIEKVALVTLTGASFLKSHGVYKRLMEGLAKALVNVMLTSQGSSEHSTIVAMDEANGKQAVQEAFARK